MMGSAYVAHTRITGDVDNGKGIPASLRAEETIAFGIGREEG
jgi:hypothetical protein